VATTTGGQLEADEIVSDDRPQQSGDSKQVEVVSGGKLSDEQLQGLWLRRVHTSPADFCGSSSPINSAVVNRRSHRHDRATGHLCHVVPCPSNSGSRYRDFTPIYTVLL